MRYKYNGYKKLLRPGFVLIIHYSFSTKALKQVSWLVNYHYSQCINQLTLFLALGGGIFKFTLGLSRQ